MFFLRLCQNRLQYIIFANKYVQYHVWQMHYVRLDNCIHIINIQGNSLWLLLLVEYDIEPVWGTGWLDLLDYHPLKKEHISCDGLCHSKFNSGNCSHKSHIQPISPYE